MASPQLLDTYTLGMVAAVNPCGFPLLPAYMEFFVDPGSDDDAGRRALRAVQAGALTTVGFLVLFGGLGLVTQLGWSALEGHSASAARYVMAVFGVAMVVFGALTLAGRAPKVPMPRLGSGRGRARPVALVVFGFSYGVASIGCALPLFIGGVATTFGHQSLWRGVAGLIAYGLGMGTILAGLALGIAVLGTGAGRLLRKAARFVPVAGGLLLVVVGAYLTWYWVTDIASPGQSFAAQRWVSRIQLDVSNPIQAHATTVGVVLGAAVVLAILAGGLVRPSSPKAPSSRRKAGPKQPKADAPVSEELAAG